MNEQEAAAKARAEREQRAENAQESIIDGPRNVAGYTLRPFSFGSNTLARKMGLTMFYEEDAEAELSETESLRQLAAFFWMQSADVDEVLGHVRAGTWEEVVERFELDLPIHHIKEMMAEVERISALASSAVVDVEKQSGNSDSKAPGN